MGKEMKTLILTLIMFIAPFARGDSNCDVFTKELFECQDKIDGLVRSLKALEQVASDQEDRERLCAETVEEQQRELVRLLLQNLRANLKARKK